MRPRGDGKLRTVSDVQKKLREELALHTERVVRGQVDSPEDYQKSVGVIKGLTTADQLLTDLLESADDDSDFRP